MSRDVPRWVLAVADLLGQQILNVPLGYPSSNLTLSRANDHGRAGGIRLYPQKGAQAGQRPSTTLRKVLKRSVLRVGRSGA